MSKIKHKIVNIRMVGSYKYNARTEIVEECLINGKQFLVNHGADKSNLSVPNIISCSMYLFLIKSVSVLMLVAIFLFSSYRFFIHW
jgi:hypothetical protein